MKKAICKIWQSGFEKRFRRWQHAWAHKGCWSSKSNHLSYPTLLPFFNRSMFHCWQLIVRWIITFCPVVSRNFMWGSFNHHLIVCCSSVWWHSTVYSDSSTYSIVIVIQNFIPHFLMSSVHAIATPESLCHSLSCFLQVDTMKTTCTTVYSAKLVTCNSGCIEKTVWDLPSAEWLANYMTRVTSFQTLERMLMW